MIVICTLDPFGAREATVTLDMPALEWTGTIRSRVRDEVANNTFVWSQHNYVRLDPHVQCAHIARPTRSSLMPPAKKTSGADHPPPELLPVDYAVLDALVEGKHATPHEVPGPHEARRRRDDRSAAPGRPTVEAVVDGEHHRWSTSTAACGRRCSPRQRCPITDSLGVPRRDACRLMIPTASCRRWARSTST